MNIQKCDDYQLIYEEKDIADLLGSSMFNPTPGKIQSVAQSIYAKTQGRFFTSRHDDVLVGIAGFSKKDNHKLVLKHLAVLGTYQRQKVASELLDYAIMEERVKEVEAETDDEGVGFYKGYGFTVTKLPFDDVRGQRYLCLYKVK